MNNPVSVYRPSLQAFSRRATRAFSLVEVVFALAIFVFAVLSIMALMATGLASASTSTSNFAIANITRSLRATYQGTNYYQGANSAGATGVFTTAGAPLTQPSFYFTSAGYATNANDPTYYSVTCTPVTTVLGATSVVKSYNAGVVTVTVAYPYPVNSQSTTFTLFLAN